VIIANEACDAAEWGCYMGWLVESMTGTVPARHHLVILQTCLPAVAGIWCGAWCLAAAVKGKVLGRHALFGGVHSLGLGCESHRMPAGD